MRSKKEINGILFEKNNYIRNHPTLIQIEMLLDIRELLKKLNDVKRDK